MKKRGLGKGLDAIFAENAGEGGEGAVTIRVSEIEPNRDQPRKEFESGALSELAESIAQHGVLQPLLLRPMLSGGYRIVAGERRWRAARMAGLSEVPAVVREMTDGEEMLFALIENLQREDLSPLEEAKGYQQLIDSQGFTQEEAASAVGKSRPAVANALRLLGLPQEIQWSIEQGTLSAGHGRALLPLPSPEAQMALAEEIQKKKLSVRETEERVKRLLQGEKPKEEAPLAIYYQEAERQLTDRLGRRVTIAQGRKKGKLTLEYYDKEDLEALMDALKKLKTGREAPQ